MLLVFEIIAKSSSLQKNMSLQSGPTTSTREEIKKFLKWDHVWAKWWVCLHFYLGLVSYNSFFYPIEAIYQSNYHCLTHNYHDSNYLQSRAILISTIKVVDDMNQYITNPLLGIEYAFNYLFCCYYFVPSTYLVFTID